MLTSGDQAPSFSLDDIAGGQTVTDPWTEGQVVLAFFKASCPVCQMVAPMLTKLSEEGVRVVAVGEDPPDALITYADTHGQKVTTVTEPAPYVTSEAYGLEAVPSIFLIDAEGTIQHAIPGWSRDTWNALAEAAGAHAPLSTPDDGLRPFRPG